MRDKNGKEIKVGDKAVVTWVSPASEGTGTAAVDVTKVEKDSAAGVMPGQDPKGPAITVHDPKMVEVVKPKPEVKPA